jgi:hypothetical protein
MNKIIKISDIGNFLVKVVFIFLFILICFSSIEKVMATTTIYECKVVTENSPLYRDVVLNSRLATTSGLEPDLSYYYYYLISAVEKNKVVSFY